MEPSPTSDRLGRLASALTPEWLAAQRWYRGKSRALTSVELLDAAQIDGSPGWLLVLGATDASGAVARYQVPVTPEGDSFREPLDGEGVWRRLAALILEGGALHGAHGRWTFTPTAAVGELLPASVDALSQLHERRLGVQQSNSSVAFGDRLILKVYRLLEPGGNPEVEMNAFLTGVGFREAPGLAGSASYLLAGEPHSAAMLQELVQSSGDGWSWALDRLAAPEDGPADAIRGAGQIGHLTARMHAALASRPEVPGFPARPATREELAAWRAAAERQLSAALAVLDGGTRPRLAAIAPRMTTAFQAIERGGAVRVTRIHGDYHLGQLLRTSDGFSIIDFEGEPARTLAERHAPASPLRDLAGMLRSLDYAAHSSAWELREHGPQDWLRDARAAFLEGYGRIGAEDAPLLAAFELEKACYEVVYEANMRPDWVWLPLEALERLMLAG
jgi:maltose alpha-D-glucosyltransferase/alpha-amylase